MSTQKPPSDSRVNSETRTSPHYSKHGLRTSSISIIQELVKKAEPWAPSQTYSWHLHSNKIFGQVIYMCKFGKTPIKTASGLKWDSRSSWKSGGDGDQSPGWWPRSGPRGKEIHSLIQMNYIDPPWVLGRTLATELCSATELWPLAIRTLQ